MEFLEASKRADKTENEFLNTPKRRPAKTCYFDKSSNSINTQAVL